MLAHGSSNKLPSAIHIPQILSVYIVEFNNSYSILQKSHLNSINER